MRPLSRTLGGMNPTRAAAAGDVTDAYAYDAYGRLLGKTGSSDQIYAFTGQLGVRHDPEAGLVHMRARHYDPVSARFLSRDPIFLALMGRNSQHANPYHFVENMPTWVVDPSGLRTQQELLQLIDRVAPSRQEKLDSLDSTAAAISGYGASSAVAEFLRNQFIAAVDATAHLPEPERSRMLARIGVILDAFGTGVLTDESDFGVRVGNAIRQDFEDVKNTLGELLAAEQSAAEAKNKAAAKALIRRGFEEFLRFVPFGVRRVDGGTSDDEFDDSEFDIK